MAKKLSAVLPHFKEKTTETVDISTYVQQMMKPPRTHLWLWFSSLLVLGIIVLGITSSLAWSWLNNVKIPVGSNVPQGSVQTLQVEHTAAYVGLQFTVVNVQYATAFADDGIHSDAAIVRLNMHVVNPSSDQIDIIYYDVVRLLAPKLNPISPTNIDLSVGPKPGTSETGWIDFSAPGGLELATLKLQFGSTALGESLVTIPFSGKFDGSRYNDRTVPETVTINYTFPYYNPQLLIYHLTSVDIRYAYRGSQVKAGQQYYVLNFRVDNPNGNKISPGFGYDYIRLSFNGGPVHPPVDNTLPYGFNGGANGVGGRVAFTGPAGLKSITVEFLVQYGNGGSTYDVTL